MKNKLAILSYSPARLALNPIVINIEAADPIIYQDRTGLRYYCRVMVPASYLSNQYTELITLEGAEVPPEAAVTGLLYQGAFFEIQEQLESLLERKAPSFNQVKIDVCAGLVTPYYCVLTIENNDEEIYRYTQPVQYAIKAGINEQDYAAYKDLFFTEFMGKNRRFLTWSPITKKIHPDQPEFLYWFTNGSPNPTSLKVCFLARYEDLTTEEGCSESLANVYPFSVHCVPVGPKALGLDKKEKIVVSYRVWLSNQADERLSEYREYRIEQEYRRNVRFVIVANSLGGYDTLYLVGRGEENLKVTRNLSDRFTGWEYLPSYSEKVINSTRGERELTISTGWLTKESLRYLEEVILTKEAYLVTDRAFVPLVPVFDSLRSKVDDEDLIGRTLTFRYGIPERNFSALPNPANLPSRSTGWRPKAMACLLDGNGKRIGKMAATLLEQYYLDDNTKVPGTPIRQNVPGQPGYIPPVESDQCLVTPFVNDAINRTGTYVRKNCTNGMTGGPAVISITAGVFGSEISKADAQAKAEAEFARINTQEYANLRGVCILQPELYEWDVPAGHFHYRASDPSKVALFFIGEGQTMGNSWDIQGAGGSYIFPQNSNDLNFPIAGNQFWWRFRTYGTPGSRQTYRVYVNGQLKFERANSQLNQDGYTHNDFPEILAAGGFKSGDKLFIQVIEL
ncbi:DUF5977 domain-containing protein [Siphonobacter sp. SORGH_AS_1065]|uniref:DUF5977 domain-containing protein n=1 Tax=Siphonobacter sp. SORGH_AS_1065 TaxID=3041795 RepID=UPI0027848222|nr:DUF5977 domain-containing protein [Siphonobacter sp. SORGH_AS_1065]MDQ1088984.1 hypothetical protein [Siphonobacter sp. SORGH_AS_1065]